MEAQGFARLDSMRLVDAAEVDAEGFFPSDKK
jgi:hypothetical protein